MSDNPIKVIHKDQEHLVSFSSDEVALLLDLCFAGACSDLLPSTNSAKTRLRGFIGQVQECLLDTAPAGVVGKAEDWTLRHLISHGDHLTHRCPRWIQDLVVQSSWAPKLA